MQTIEKFDVAFSRGGGITQHTHTFEADLDDWSDNSLAAQIWRHVTPMITGVDLPKIPDPLPDYLPDITVMVDTRTLTGKVVIKYTELERAGKCTTVIRAGFNVLRHGPRT